MRRRRHAAASCIQVRQEIRALVANCLQSVTFIAQKVQVKSKVENSELILKLSIYVDFVILDPWLDVSVWLQLKSAPWVRFFGSCTKKPNNSRSLWRRALRQFDLCRESLRYLPATTACVKKKNMSRSFWNHANTRVELENVCFEK